MKLRHFLFSLLALLASTVSFADVPEGNITFEDEAVKAICVANWDTNGDGELSYAEATSVTTIGTVFRGNAITSFNEFQYFTGLTSIENFAFQYCGSLTSLIIPEGVTSIGSEVFHSCSSLTSVTIPSSVTSIGSRPFYECSYRLFVYFVSITPCTLSSGTIGSNITKIVVPHEAVAAYREAWSSDANYIVDASLMNLTVEVTAKADASAVIEAIGEEHARDVVSLKVKGTFNSYDLMAFRNKMINLMHLDLSEANVVANSYKYYSSYSSKDNIITGNFAPTGIVSLKLPKDITALEFYAFYDCARLKAIELPEGITSIPNRAFYGCHSLTSVNIPSTVTRIETYAFNECI